MKRYLVIAFLCMVMPLWVYAATDTFEGETVTDDNYIEGENTTDTVEGQVLKAMASVRRP